MVVPLEDIADEGLSYMSKSLGNAVTAYERLRLLLANPGMVVAHLPEPVLNLGRDS